MKKKYIYSILLISFITIATIGVTYAFFVATTSSKNNINTTSQKFEVIYSGGGEITGPLKFGLSKEEGKKTSVNIKVAPGSIEAKGIIYINIEEISPELAVSGFNWEVVGTKNNLQVYNQKGTFAGTNNTTNKIINIVDDYLITEDNTKFDIYLWLDGNKLGNEVLTSSFKGYIGAKVDNFTAILS